MSSSITNNSSYIDTGSVLDKRDREDEIVVAKTKAEAAKRRVVEVPGEARPLVERELQVGGLVETEEQLIDATLSLDDGSTYVGVFKNGQPDGKGKLSYSKGPVLERKGRFEKGIFVEGTIEYSDGRIYNGACKNDPNGSGVMEFKDGKKLKGYFDGSKAIGTLTQGNQVYYKGECLDDQLEGLGEFRTLSGRTLFGVFTKGNIGPGNGSIEILPNGQRSYGGFKNNRIHGRAIFIHPEGNYFIGEFNEGKLHGQGIFLWADGTVLKRGEWIEGKFAENIKH